MDRSYTAFDLETTKLPDAKKPKSEIIEYSFY